MASDPNHLKYRIMRLLESEPELTQRQLSSKLGISLGGINYCIKALTQKGFLKLKNFKNSSNKTRYYYMITPRGIAEKTSLTVGFLSKKMAEYRSLKIELASLYEEIGQEPDFENNDELKEFKVKKRTN